MGAGPFGAAAMLRTLKILRDLQARWWRVAELATRHKASTKTVRRALDVINKAGFRLRVKIETNGRKAYRQK